MHKHVTEQNDLEIVWQIRTTVFVEEQKVPSNEEFDEFDQLEAEADHILVFYDGQPVGTGRLRVIDQVAKLERICILPAYRKYGLGKEIVTALEQIAKNKGIRKAKLNAQAYAEVFYQKSGYQTVSDIFMEADIPHVLMIKNLG